MPAPGVGDTKMVGPGIAVAACDADGASVRVDVWTDDATAGALGAAAGDPQATAMTEMRNKANARMLNSLERRVGARVRVNAP